MTELAEKRHGLEKLIEAASSANASDAGVEIRVRSDVGHLNLRGKPDDRSFVDAAESVLGQALPIEANTSSAADHCLYWLGPDEWLILADAALLNEVADRLRDSLEGVHASINDVTGGQILLQVSGSAARDVFAKGCTLDLHPRAFTTSTCAQSGLGKANVLFGLPGEPDEFDLVVRRTFSEYLLRWLIHSAAEFGSRVIAK